MKIILSYYIMLLYLVIHLMTFIYFCLKQLQTVQAEGAKKTGRLRTLPPRSTQIQSLHSEEFDVLIIGGGATGAGCAIDSVTRGKIFNEQILGTF